MPNTWLSIRVELLSGRSQRLWPQPGRIFAASRTHTFSALAQAIDSSFARWDMSHLHEFRFEDGRTIGMTDPEFDPDEDVMDDKTTKLSILKPADQFVYIYDFGDDWQHWCTIAMDRIDPRETLGIVPNKPFPYFGWGQIPDQYGRRWEADDGVSPVPPDPNAEAPPPENSLL